VTTQILVASAAEGVLAAAATGAGLLDRPERQVLLTSVDDLDATVAEVGADDVELVVGTSALPQGRALTRRWGAAPVSLLAAGASVYGPTPGALGNRLAKRVDRVLHLDLVPGLEPLLLAERGVPARAVPVEHHRAVAGSPPGAAALPDPTTLVLGGSTPWGGAFDSEAQTELLVAMVQRCAEAGHSRILLLLDADPVPRARRRLDEASHGARVDLTVVVDRGPAEAWFARDGVDLVVGCATDDLLVARTVFGHRVAQLDTDVVLKRLDPFADPRRTGATLVGAGVPDLRTWTSSPEGEDLQTLDLAGLMTTVAYAMQPDLLAARRAEAIDFLERHADTRRRFVRRRRLTALRLPGGKRKVHAHLG
jgi:hypothetical protein